MRSILIFAGVVAANVLAAASTVSAAETATASAVVSAQFSSRTSLKVSTDLLRFEVAGPGQPATAAVDFAAGARTQAGAEVLLSIEQLHAVEGPGGASDLES